MKPAAAQDFAIIAKNNFVIQLFFWYYFIDETSGNP